jgi:hypothetical protein
MTRTISLFVLYNTLSFRTDNLRPGATSRVGSYTKYSNYRVSLSLITYIYYKKTTWNTNVFLFQNVTQLKKFVYNTLVHFNMCYVCILRSFLVINVCNQGKTLCSTCSIISTEEVGTAMA